jgi:F-type H+-transporting ATPase subunit c
MRNVWMWAEKTKERNTTMMMELITMAQAAAAHAADTHAAGVTGNLTSALGAAGAAIGVGLIGSKGVEAVGRNPGAFGSILTLGIIAMALAEGLGIMALFAAK